MDILCLFCSLVANIRDSEQPPPGGGQEHKKRCEMRAEHRPGLTRCSVYGSRCHLSLSLFCGPTTSPPGNRRFTSWGRFTTGPRRGGDAGPLQAQLLPGLYLEQLGKDHYTGALQITIIIVVPFLHPVYEERIHTSFICRVLERGLNRGH